MLPPNKTVIVPTCAVCGNTHRRGERAKYRRGRSSSRPRLFAMFLASIHFQHTVPFSKAYMNLEQLRYYDDLRTRSRNITVDYPPDEDSNVIAVRLVGGGGASSPREEDMYRLTHLSNFLPQTNANGDIFPIGISSNAAALMAVYHYNNKIDTVVPQLTTDPTVRSCDVRLTVDFQDTQKSALVAETVLLNDVLARDHSLQTPLPSAIVGAYFSSVAAPLSIVAGVNRKPIPTISSSASSPDLDSSDTYPYFGRTIPTDRGATEAAVHYFKDVLNVTHVAIVYVRDNFGSNFHSWLMMMGDQIQSSLNFQSAAYDPTSSIDELTGIMQRLQKSGYNYFFCISHAQEFKKVAMAAHNAKILGPGKYWLFNGNLGTIFPASLPGSPGDADREIDGDVLRALTGSSFLGLDTTTNPGFEDEWSRTIADRAFNKYLIGKHNNSLNLSSHDIPSTPSQQEALHYDAVMALGIAACNTRAQYFSGPALFEAFTKTSFLGASGTVNFDRDTGNRNFNTMSYVVTNVVTKTDSFDGRAKPVETIVARGYVPSNHVSPSDVTSESSSWQVLRQTQYASGTSAPPLELPPLQSKTETVSMWACILSLILAGLIAVMSVLGILWTARYSRTNIVKTSQPCFLYLLCLGTMVMGLAMIPSAVLAFTTHPALCDAACMLKPWMFQLGFVLMFSSLFSKARRVTKIYNIYDSARLTRGVEVKKSDAAIPFLAILLPFVAIFVAWTVVSPLRLTLIPSKSVDRFGRTVVFHAKCDSQYHLMFDFLILVLNIVVLGYALWENERSRGKITAGSGYNEATYISYALAAILQSLVVGLPLLYMLEDQSTAEMVVRCLLILLATSVVLIFMFVPKEIERRRIRSERSGLASSRKPPQRTWSEVVRHHSPPPRSTAEKTADSTWPDMEKEEVHLCMDRPPLFSLPVPEEESSMSNSSTGSESSDLGLGAWNPRLDQLAL